MPFVCPYKDCGKKFNEKRVPLDDHQNPINDNQNLNTTHTN